MTLLEVRGLVKRYPIRESLLRSGVHTAVDGVSLQVEPSAFVALIGESGCGKSSLGRCVLRLVDPDAGSVLLRGRRIDDLPGRAFRPLRRELQMVFQNPLTSFDPMRTLREALVEALELRRDLTRRQRRAEAVELLGRVGLSGRFADRYPRDVSGGELQRAAVARAVAPNPAFVFLDEPTSALDMSIQGQIVELLQQLRADDGMSYLLASHDLRVVRHVAEQLQVMYLGQIVESGPAPKLFASPAHPYTRGLLEAARVRRKRGTRRVSLRGELGEAADPGRGCRLAPRCLHATDRCREQAQELQELEPRHAVRCWRAAAGEI